MLSPLDGYMASILVQTAIIGFVPDETGDVKFPHHV